MVNDQSLRISTVLFCLLINAALAANVVVAADFSREIRPILSDKCFTCHGPDAGSREADLRLDLRESAVNAGAITAGDLDASTLIERITSTDPDLVMPPPSTDKHVTAEEVALFKEWIADGAEYQGHYAFTKPERPTVPNSTDSEWGQTPIDAFVLRRLERNGLEPSHSADRRTLLRRMSLDLTGLPPTPNEVEAYIQDNSSEATQKVIDRLLASRHYGEKWGRWWLDAARYADSDGYEKDKPRSVWFYRDWVIDSLNNDKPYNQFVIEQIAGDLLPNAGQDERVATGFLRNSMINEEGGADPEQFRIEGMFDRMDAIGKAVLGITTQCAQCHTHKYDPLTQREYYEMFACLNDFHEATLTVYTRDEAARRHAVLSQIAALEGEIKATTPDWRERMAEWERETLAVQPQWQVVVPTERPFEGQKFRPLNDGSIVSESYAPTKNAATFRATIPAANITGFRLEALTHPQLPHNGPGRSIYGTGALTEFKAELAPASNRSKRTPFKWASAVAEINPSEQPLGAPFLNKDASKDDRKTGPIAFAIDGSEKTAWTTDNGPGRRNVSRQAVFLAEEPVVFDRTDSDSEPGATEPGNSVESDDSVELSITLVQKHGGWNSDDNQNYLLGRYRFSVTTDDLSEFEIVPHEIGELLGKRFETRTDAENDAVFSHWRTTVAEFSAINDKIEALWKEHPHGSSQLVAQTTGQPRPTSVLTRGDFLSPAETVEPNVPAFLNPIPNSDEAPRLRFAKWLAADDSPTTSRTVINRIWQEYFGRGLVTTPEDLGYQSPAPSHPDLLDWLSVELVENDWSLKRIHRLILNSSVYQQSSHVTPEGYRDDQYNEFLARGPRFRVNAESVRDIALFVSGLLDESVGGPSVYPDAPSFLFVPPASYGPKQWPVSTGDEQFRRSLYVHQYRSVPFPPLQVFDAPKGDAACVRRERSNTPLQALVVLNEPQFVHCAQQFATRITKDAATDKARIERAYELALSRKPTDDEIAILTKLLMEQRQRLGKKELDAAAIAGVENASAEQAAWTVVARAILNLDETITKP